MITEKFSGISSVFINKILFCTLLNYIFVAFYEVEK